MHGVMFYAHDPHLLPDCRLLLLLLPLLTAHRCLFKQDALVAPLGFTRPFGVSVGVLLGYLGVLHVLTFLGLLMATRNERR